MDEDEDEDDDDDDDDQTQWKQRISQPAARLNTLLKNLTRKGWNETIPFYKLASQKCSDMIIRTKWKSKSQKGINYEARQTVTDYGACCMITPYLDFENTETKDKLPSTYTGEDYHSIPEGYTHNGIKNGLEIMLDVESYEYAYFQRYAIMIIEY
jgi:hypothetical protein